MNNMKALEGSVASADLVGWRYEILPTAAVPETLWKEACVVWQASAGLESGRLVYLLDGSAI
jgi:hypothetical protein